MRWRFGLVWSTGPGYFPASLLTPPDSPAKANEERTAGDLAPVSWSTGESCTERVESGDLTSDASGSWTAGPGPSVRAEHLESVLTAFYFCDTSLTFAAIGGTKAN